MVGSDHKANPSLLRCSNSQYLETLVTKPFGSSLCCTRICTTAGRQLHLGQQHGNSTAQGCNDMHQHTRQCKQHFGSVMNTCLSGQRQDEQGGEPGIRHSTCGATQLQELLVNSGDLVRSQGSQHLLLHLAPETHLPSTRNKIQGEAPPLQTSKSDTHLPAEVATRDGPKCRRRAICAGFSSLPPAQPHKGLESARRLCQFVCVIPRGTHKQRHRGYYIFLPPAILPLFHYQRAQTHLLPDAPEEALLHD